MWFGPPPPNFVDKNRRITRWVRYTKENYLYQGEMDLYGNRDGRGVTILPGKGLFVGHYLNGKCFGEMMGFMSDQHTEWLIEN